ncbi:MAG TPA: ABC transporter ATP-binding protein [Candidatus Saccharimonadales bacterium]|nr:ABC transporter ATP-binding protein [Candidatus Saccharimonadales bacterium]
MVVLQVVGAIISALLPLITTYYAALTTTALAGAYAGDHAAGQQAILYVIITSILGILMTVWRSIEQFTTQLMRYKIEAGISDRMYEHFLSLDFWRYDDKDTADMYDKAKQFSQFFAYVFDRLAGIVALVLVNWILGIILVLAIIPGIIIQFKLSRAQTKHWNENVEVRRAKSQIEWNLFEPQYIAELRLYSLVRHLLDLRTKLRDKDEKQRIEFERKYIFKRLGADALEAGAEVITLLFTVVQIIGRAQPVGQFLYVQQVVSRALGGASSFVGQINMVDEDIANLFDYQKFMSLPEHRSGHHMVREAPNIIELRNVSFRYPNAKADVLQGISLTIKKHQHVAIVGENGAGKSTLIKILTGLYIPSSGNVEVDGKDLRDINTESWHRLLGVLRQDYLAFSFATARENIYFGDVTRPMDSERFNKAVDKAEARKFLRNSRNNTTAMFIHGWKTLKVM